MRKIWAVATSELLRLKSDKTAIFFTIVLPVVLIYFVGSITAGFDMDAWQVGIVAPRDAGAFSTDLREALDDHKRLDLMTYDDRDDLARAVRRGNVSAGIVIPDDYDARLADGAAADVELLIDQTRAGPAGVRSIVSEVISERGGVLQAAVFARQHTGTPLERGRAEAERSSEIVEGVKIGVESSTVGTSDDQETLGPGIGYQAPSNLVLFVFITSITGASLLVSSRQLRVLHRMYATPTSARDIILGAGLAKFLLAAGQALFIFLIARLLFDVDFGNAIGALLLIVLFVLVGTSVGMLFGTIFSTPEQAGPIGSMSGIAMGMLGGCMWPLEIVPSTMRTIGHAFPHAWAMDGWIELIGRDGTVGDIVPNLLVLAGYVAVLMPLAIWRLRKALTT